MATLAADLGVGRTHSMSVTVEVVVDLSSMARGGTGAITGTVALRAGDIWFPNRSWNDFVVVVLGWWTRQAAALRSGDPARFDFMDGDYSFVVRPAPKGLASLTCLRGRGDAAAILEEVEVSTADVVSEVMKGAQQVLGFCAQRRWESPDTEALRQWAE